MTFKIEKGVKIPAARLGAGTKWHILANMEIGDSFLVPGAKRKDGLGGRLAYWKMKTGFEFTLRTLDDGVRIWRIK